MKNNCPVCLSLSLFKYKWQKDGQYQLLECSSCSLIFISPDGYPHNPKQQYEADETSPSEYYKLTAEIDKRNFARTIKELGHYQAPGTFLDVGANIGTFLGVAKELGWIGLGVEPNPKAVNIAKSAGLDNIQGFFDDNFVNWLRNNRPSISIDAIHMGDVIEHVFDPLLLLRTAKKVLKPKGYLVIVTPDIDKFLARKYQIKPKEHLVYFNKKSLRVALEKTGFDVVVMRGQSRIRDIGNIERGTVKLSPIEQKIAAIARLPFVGTLLNLSLQLFKDELFVLARARN